MTRPLSLLLATILVGAASLFPSLGTRAQEPSTQFAPPFSLELHILTDVNESDLRPFLQKLYASIRTQALEKLPKSVTHGEQGTVVVQLRIQKNGKLAFEPRIVSSSGKDTLDHHAISSIRNAVPFDRLPPSSPAPITLRLTFYYNTTPPPPR